MSDQSTTTTSCGVFCDLIAVVVVWYRHYEDRDREQVISTDAPPP